MTSLNVITDENNKKIADWYITDPPKGFVIDFMTLDSSKCKVILNTVLKELGADMREVEE